MKYLKPKQRIYIDARHENFQLGNVKQVTYIIKEVDQEHIKTRIYDAIGPHSLKIEILPNSEKLIVTYYENITSPTYLDYQFHLKGLVFKRIES